MIEIWSDIDNRFKLDNTGDLNKAFNSESVTQSVENIISINHRDLVMDPDFGCGLSEYLSYPITENTAKLLALEIKSALNQEPRITVHLIQVIPEPDFGAYEITVEFSIIELNIQESLVRILRK